MDQSRDPLLKAISVLLICFAVYMSVLDGRLHQSADLLAMWLAAEFLAMGQPEQVYPAVQGLFDMTVPAAWLDQSAKMGSELKLYPYIYPPLWAKLVSFITPWGNFASFDVVLMVIHQGAMLLGSFLAARMGGLRGGTLWLGFALTYAGLVLTLPAGLALGENQPQMMVSFLIVAAFAAAQTERARTAGVLLALAASIKVYPLFFIVIFIGRRDWRAVSAFIVAGAALGGLSVALAGWALHAEYLHLLNVVSRSVIVSTFSFSIDAVVAMTAFRDDLINVAQSNPDAAAAGWSVVAKSGVWAAVSGVAQITGLVCVGVIAAKHPHDALVVPLAAAIFALLSPLSWAYTYLTTFFFMAPMVVRLGRTGIIMAMAFVAAFHPAIATFTLDLPIEGVWAFWIIGIVLIVALTACFLLAILRGDRSRSPG